MSIFFKIFHFTSNLSGGGAETQMVLLAHQLAKEGMQQYIVYQRKESTLELPHHENLNFLKISEFKKNKSLYCSQASIFHVWIPDVFTHISPLFFIKYRSNTILGIRNVYKLNSLKRVYQLFCFILFKNFVSNTPKEIHSSIYKLTFGKKFNFIPNAIKYNINESVQVNSSSESFLFVGRLVSQKGILELAQAYSQLYKEGLVRQPLSIIGTGPLLKTIKNLNTNNILATKGYIANPKNEYINHDVFILPSYHEGMPNVAFEALSQKCILILSDIPQHRLWFTENEAIFFKPGDVSDLKKAILKAKNMEYEKKRRILSNGLIIIRRLSLENYATSYLKYYNSLYEPNTLY